MKRPSPRILTMAATAASLAAAALLFTPREPSVPLPTGTAAPLTEDGTLLVPTGPASPPPTVARGAATEFGFVSMSWATPWIPDCALAVGPAHIVTPMNGTVRFFTKSGVMTSDQPLWGPGGFFTIDPDSGFVFDPVALFDPHSQRFVVAAARRSPERIYVSVSDDSDPNGAWHEYEFDTSVLGTATDFPCIGVDNATVYVTVKMEGPIRADRGMYALMFEKAPMLTGGTPIIKRRLLSSVASSLVFAGVTTYDTNVPAQYFASSPTNPQSGSNTLRLSAIEDPQGLRTLTTFDLPIAAWSWQHLIPELGNTVGIENEPGHFYKHGIFRNGSLWVTNTVGPSAGAGKAVVRWYEVSMNDWPVSGVDPVLAQWGEIDLGDTPAGDPISAFYADVAVDNAGNAAFVFHSSSAGQYAGIMRAYRRFDDPPGFVGGLVTWAQGTSANTGISRWGDYVSVDEDPAEPGTFWGHAEYRDGGEWRTWVGKFVGGSTTSIDEGIAVQTPQQLHAARPNPFQKRTFLNFTLNESKRVRISVHDVSGRHLRTLAEDRFSAGPHDVVWDGRNEDRLAVPNGVYFVRLESNGAVETRKVTLLR